MNESAETSPRKCAEMEIQVIYDFVESVRRNKLDHAEICRVLGYFAALYGAVDSVATWKSVETPHKEPSNA